MICNSHAPQDKTYHIEEGQSGRRFPNARVKFNFFFRRCFYFDSNSTKFNPNYPITTNYPKFSIDSDNGPVGVVSSKQQVITLISTCISCDIIGSEVNPVQTIPRFKQKFVSKSTIFQQLCVVFLLIFETAMQIVVKQYVYFVISIWWCTSFQAIRKTQGKDNLNQSK